jgi:hypothetical protein
MFLFLECQLQPPACSVIMSGSAPCPFPLSLSSFNQSYSCLSLLLLLLLLLFGHHLARHFAIYTHMCLLFASLPACLVSASASD